MNTRDVLLALMLTEGAVEITSESKFLAYCKEVFTESEIDQYKKVLDSAIELFENEDSEINAEKELYKMAVNAIAKTIGKEIML